MEAFSHLPQAFIDALGEEALYHPANTAASLPMRGIFRRPYQPVALNPMTGEIASTAPTLDLPSAVLPAMHTAGDEVTVRGERFVIIAVQPDGMGMTRLILQPLT
jgi:hypothetical protein